MFEWLWTLIKIPTAALVRGDIVYIKGGDKVPVMTEMIKTSRLIIMCATNRPMFVLFILRD